MSPVGSLRERLGRWRERTRLRRRVLAKRLALDRWYPQLPLALAMVPLGLLLVDFAADSALGVGLTSFEIRDLERQASVLNQRPILEAALGLSFIVMSVGIAFRSRPAWLWAVAAVAAASLSCCPRSRPTCRSCSTLPFSSARSWFIAEPS